MGKKKGIKKAKGAKVEVYSSDDERAYVKQSQPDPGDDSFFHDEIDNFHSNREKILLDKGVEQQNRHEDTDEEEVLGLGSDSDDDKIEEYEKRLKKFQSEGFKDELASDLEDDKDDFSVDKAWGSSRNKYYGADISDDEHPDFSGSEPDTAQLEEQEALAIQKRMAEQLDDEDFGLDIFKTVKKTDTNKISEESEEIIEKDLSKLTKAEKIQLLKKESPELLQLAEDYKAKMQELQERILPVQKLIREGKLPNSNGAEYIEAKVKLYLNYCINVSFYMMLKAKRTSIESHPVIKRIVQYRNLIKQMESIDTKVATELDELLQKIKNGEPIDIKTTPESDETETYSKRKKKLAEKTKKTSVKEKRKLSSVLKDDSEEDSDGVPELTDRELNKKRKKEDRAEGRYETKGEQAALDYYEMMKAGKTKQDSPEESSSDEDDENDQELGERAGDLENDDVEEMEEEENQEGDGKRAITYQMAKNKGLMPKRKKEQRNPRVKHRNKYRKAKIRRKGQVREVRTEMHKYGGEISGIRAGIKRSVKFK